MKLFLAFLPQLIGAAVFTASATLGAWLEHGARIVPFVAICVVSGGATLITAVNKAIEGVDLSGCNDCARLQIRLARAEHELASTREALVALEVK